MLSENTGPICIEENSEQNDEENQDINDFIGEIIVEENITENVTQNDSELGEYGNSEIQEDIEIPAFLSCFEGNAISYFAGYVAKKICTKYKCSEGIQSLISST